MKRPNLTNNNHVRFWCLLGILLLLIMIRYSIQVDIPRVIFIAVISLVVLFGDQDEVMAMILCCIPLHESVDFFYTLVLCTVVYVLKFYRQIRLRTDVLLILLMIVWELLHCLRSSFSIMTFISNVIPLIVLAVMMAADVKMLDYAFIVRAVAWVTLGVSLVLFLKVLFFSNFNIPVAIAGLRRLGSDQHSGIVDVAVSGGQINPNTLGIVTVLVSTGLMQIKSMKRGRAEDMVLMCAVIVFAALGASRTYLVCLVLMMVLLILSEKGGIVRKTRSMFKLLCIITVAMCFFAMVFPENFEYYVSRFSVADITTGRDDLMVRYHNFIVRNPDVMIFGIGLQNFGDRLIEYYRVAENVPHNSIQELVIAWGLPGVFLFVALILTMIAMSKKHCKHQSLINYIPLIIILVKGMAGQMLNSPYTMLAFSYAYLSLCADLSPKDEQRIFTRTQTIPRGSGHNINPSFRKDKKRGRKRPPA